MAIIIILIEFNIYLTNLFKNVNYQSKLFICKIQYSKGESQIVNRDIKYIYSREKYEIKGKTREAEAEQAVKTKEMFEEKRKAFQASLDERIARRMRDLDLTFPSKVEELEPEEEEEEEEELVPLTPEMEVCRIAITLTNEVLLNRESKQIFFETR